MKKIISVVIAVAMLLSLVVPFKAPTAEAFPGTTVVLTTENFTTLYRNSKLSQCSVPPSNTNPYWMLDHFSVFSTQAFVNSPGVITQLNDCTLGTSGMKYELYRMGEYVYGYVTGHTFSSTFWGIYLVKQDASSSTGYRVIDAQKQSVGTNRFSIATANAEYDGEYLLVFTDGVDYYPGDPIDPSAGSGVFGKEAIWIAYNLTINPVTINACATSVTITGRLSRASGFSTITQQVQLGITYPDLTIAGIYDIVAGSSGDFTFTFPIDHNDPNYPDRYIGKYYIYVRSEAYDGFTGLFTDEPNTYGRFIYTYIDNTPEVEMTLSTYIDPTFIYRNTSGQPLILKLTDGKGNFVSDKAGDGLLDDIIFTPTNAVIVNYDEISPGIFRFIVDVGNVVDIRISAKKNFYGEDVYSNTLVINTRTKGVYNPYIDLNAIYSIPPYGIGPTTYLAQNVYDKLPCTIGNAFEVFAGYYLPADPDHYYIYDFTWTVASYITENGEETVNKYGLIRMTGVEGYRRYLVAGNGTVKVSVSMQAWKKANDDCDDWYHGVDGGSGYIDEELMKYNACCAEPFNKDFKICTVESCDIQSISLSGGNEVNPQTIEVGKKANLGISPKENGISTSKFDLSCSCPYDVVWMYMVDGQGNIVSNAFTIDTWPTGSVTVSEIWYNPNNAPGTVIVDQPITFKPTTVPEATDCPFAIRGLTFNYPTGTDCGYKLVLKMFGRLRQFDECGNVTTTWPMIGERINPITVLPKITKLSAEATIWEGQQDPGEILAGVSTVIDITKPGFTLGNPIWKFYLNGDLVSANYSPLPDGGYRFSNICLDDEGTFVIYGYVYGTGCKTIEEITLEFKVVKPEFTVKIGLSDGSVIDNDKILTEGFIENVYVTPIDPRVDIKHNFSDDVWGLKVVVEDNDCGLPPAIVCYDPIPGECCTTSGGIAVSGYDNPCLNDVPTIDLYFVSGCGAEIYVGSFTLEKPVVKVEAKDIHGEEIDIKKIPYTYPPTPTHLIFTVTDAHQHGAPGISVGVLGSYQLSAGSGGYSNVSYFAGTTGTTGEVDWIFHPTGSGKFYVEATMNDTCELPCGWYGINTTATFETVYKAPVVDTTAPVVTVTAPAEVTTSTVKITGKATDNVGVVAVWIGAKQASVAPDGTFEAVLELVAGDNTFTVSAYDAANNVGTKSVTIKYVVPQVTKIVLKIGSDIMMVNDKAVQLDAAAEIKNGRTFLPLRAIAEAFGATVTWVPETQGITVVLGDTQIGLQIGNNTAVINGNVISIEPPYIKNSRTMVPFRVISEAFGADVQWDPINYIVTVTLQG